MNLPALLVMAHGSRDAEARDEYRRVHQALVQRLDPHRVVFAVLEFPDDDGDLPSIEEGWRRCLVDGPSRVVALPFFLFPAGHVREDLPAALRAARDAVGWAPLDLLPPLGAADALLDAVDARAQEALVGLPPGDGDTAVVLVGAGTSDPDANGDLCKAARLVWERYQGRYALVEPAWVSLTRPTVQEAVERCARLGAGRVVAVPYFLNTGVLLKRVDRRLAEARERHPALPVARAGHLGLHERVLDLLEARARDAFARPAEEAGLLAVCGRPSCQSVASGRTLLFGEAAPAR